MISYEGNKTRSLYKAFDRRRQDAQTSQERRIALWNFSRNQRRHLELYVLLVKAERKHYEVLTMEINKELVNKVRLKEDHCSLGHSKTTF
jgi:hypothetical protein